MALKRKWMPSPNYSSRGGAGVRLIVVHTAEGATTIESLGNFFANPSAQVSSHVGIDDKANTVGEYVKPPNKAWTAADFNPQAIQAELCGFAKWTTNDWKNKHPTMLDNCAKWIAEEAKRYGLPITKLSAGAAQGSGRGVCGHADLGAKGGNHWDPGGGFPWSFVIDKAKGYASGSGGGGKDDYMDPPAWLWDWLRWYETTPRKKSERPKSAPEKIPKWAWDYQEEVHNIALRMGMTVGERDWMDWLRAGKPDGKRPNVPQTIPGNWWTDNEYVVAKS